MTSVLNRSVLCISVRWWPSSWRTETLKVLRPVASYPILAGAAIKIASSSLGNLLFGAAAHHKNACFNPGAGMLKGFLGQTYDGQ